MLTCVTVLNRGSENMASVSREITENEVFKCCNIVQSKRTIRHRVSPVVASVVGGDVGLRQRRLFA